LIKSDPTIAIWGVRGEVRLRATVGAVNREEGRKPSHSRLMIRSSEGRVERGGSVAAAVGECVNFRSRERSSEVGSFGVTRTFVDEL